VLRIRIFRILLPLIFVAVIALLVWAIRPIPVASRPTIAPNETIEAGVDKVGVKVFGLGSDGALRKTLDVVSGSFKECGENCLEAIDIEQFEIARADADALVVLRAASSKVVGEEGNRDMNFTGPVVLYDPDLEIQVEMPALNVDEAAGLARSDGAVRIENDDQVTDAASLTYGLNGQPTRLDRLELQDQDGGLLVARTAYLHDGFSDIEFQFGVRYKRGEEQRFWAETARIKRDDRGTTRSIVASGNFTATSRAPDGSLLEIAADTVHGEWGEDGALEKLLLDGDALAERGQERLSADRIELAYNRVDQRWDVVAADAVRAVIAFGATSDYGRLRADQLEASFDDDFLLLDAAAVGAVEFRAPELLAEAATAQLTASPDIEGGAKKIELLSGNGRRARLAQGETRVVADRIVTDSAGSTMDAQGRVESTLLAATADDSQGEGGLFKPGEAIHFISGSLVGVNKGSQLKFSEGVRGWQGDQNLSAQEVTLSQEDGSLLAKIGVTTRFPRQSSESATTAQSFVQISSESLEYSQSLSEALYRGSVRTVLDEGWIESDLLRVTQSTEAGADLQELQAEGSIQLEFADTESRTQGSSDRLIYLPARDTLWLYGDERPAEVERSGKTKGTTRGRVLRYRIDDGSLFVESGRIVATPQAEPTDESEAKDPEETP
jgi:lipopolysaccharide transport protein LptA